MNFQLAVGLTAMLTTAVCQAQPPTLDLFTFDSAPYQMAGTAQGGTNQISGETVDTVVCAANRAGWSTRIRITPQNRAIHSLERSMIDGYFAIDPSAELDNIAKRSDPMALEKWYFFTRANKAFTSNLEAFVSDYPDFLGTFNRTLNSCMAGQLALSREEERRITDLSGRLFEEMNSVLDIRQIIDAGPRQESFTDVMTIDSQWQALVPVTTPDLAERILALPGSRALLAWQESHRGLVTEVMLINDMGTLAAMSQLTSDYWQGDEPKFQRVMENRVTGTEAERRLYISPIRYDTSAARFQITASTPVVPGHGKSAIGVAVIGLSIEEALSQVEQY